MAYLVKPIKQSDLEPVIALATRRFEQLQSLRREAAALRDSLVEHEVIERAMRVLVKWAEDGKEDALDRLQRMAKDKNLEVAEIAQMIVTADEVLGPTTEPE
jgi:response regulator NasT